MNEELKRALMKVLVWPSHPEDQAQYIARLWSVIERWHEREVAHLTHERSGMRKARDIALEDNQRLREEVDSLKAALRARDAVIARLEAEAHAEPHPGCEGPDYEDTPATDADIDQIEREVVDEHPEAPKQEPRLPLCVRCGQPLQPGLNVGYWVQADGTIRPGHYECHRPEVGAQR